MHCSSFCSRIEAREISRVAVTWKIRGRVELLSHMTFWVLRGGIWIPREFSLTQLRNCFKNCQALTHMHQLWSDFSCSEERWSLQPQWDKRYMPPGELKFAWKLKGFLIKVLHDSFSYVVKFLFPSPVFYLKGSMKALSLRKRVFIFDAFFDRRA